MNNTIFRGTFKIKDLYTVFYEYCTKCKNMRCVMKSDLSNKTVEFQSDYYPGRSGISILSSLALDVESKLIPKYEDIMKGKTSKVEGFSTYIVP